VDVALVFGTAEREFDLVLAGGDLETDEGLNTAISISLFTDGRASRDERLPTENSDRRGWWGDTFAPVEGDEIGSLLWLLQRQKLTVQLQARVEREVERALEWLVEDGIAAGIEVTSEILKPDRLHLRVIVERPDAARVEFQHAFVWEGVESAL